MILMRAYPLQGPLEVVGLENQDFLGPEMSTIGLSAILGPKCSDFQAHPCWIFPHENHSVQTPYKKKYIDNLMYKSFARCHFRVHPFQWSLLMDLVGAGWRTPHPFTLLLLIFVFVFSFSRHLRRESYGFNCWDPTP
jgi:hypothetical protein